MKGTVAIYARISQLKEDLDVSIGQQIESGKAFAKSKDMDYAVYTDEGFSGTLNADKRPAMYQLLKDIVKKDSQIKILWGRENFRLYRGNEPKKQIQVTCVKHSIKIYYGDKLYTPSDPMEKFIDEIMGAVGGFYVDLTKQNIKQAIDKNFKDGKAHGATPLGYKKDDGKVLEIDNERAKVVRDIYKWHIEGLGVVSIANKLNDLGIPSQYRETSERFRQDWGTDIIYKILRNPLYMGKRLRKERKKDEDGKMQVVKTVTYDCPAIVSESTFNKSLQAFEDNKNFTGVRTFHKYLLNDLLICGSCYDKYLGRSGHNGKDFYGCNGRRKENGCKLSRNLKKDIIERFVWDYVSEGGVLLDVLLDKTDDGLKKRRQDLDGKLTLLEKGADKIDTQNSNLVRLAVQGLLSDAELSSDKKRLEREKLENGVKLTKLKEQIESLASEKDLRADILSDFHKLTGKKYKTGLPRFEEFIKHREVQKKVIETNYPYNEKQQILYKYLNSINVIFTNGIFELTFKFKEPLADRVVYMDRKYYVAVDAQTKLLYDLNNEKEHLTFDNLNELMYTVAKIGE